MYDDSYELLKHGKPSNVMFSVPEYLKESGDELFEYFNIIHNVIAERLYDTFIYEIKKLEKAGRSGKLIFRHSTGSIENESKEE